MLSEMFAHLGMPLISSWIISWKYSPESDAPIIKRLKRWGPSSGVVKAVIYLDSSARVSCR